MKILLALFLAMGTSAWRLFPVPPSKDDFYNVPENLAGISPGTILEHREAPNTIGAFGVKTNLSSAHQILYRTTDGHGNATATVLSVLIPPKANFSAVLSFQMAEDAVSIDCAPSYGILLESSSLSRTKSATAQLQLLLIEAALAEGWVVIVPDFEGPQASFVDTILAGRSTLDGIRAALGSGYFTNINRGATVTLWGYSAGAAVTQIASGLQPTYASDINIAGAAMGGLSAQDISPATFSDINKGPHAGLIPMSLIAVAKESPEFDASIEKHLLKKDKTKFNKPKTQCLDANLKTFNNVDVLGMFDCWDKCVLADLLTTLGKHNTTTPIPRSKSFIYHCLHDELMPIELMDKVVEKYCSQGSVIHYQRDLGPTVNHRNYGVLGAPHAIEWLRGIINGTDSRSACSKETVESRELPEWFLNAYPRNIRNALVKLVAGSPKQANFRANDLLAGGDEPGSLVPDGNYKGEVVIDGISW